MKPTCPKCGNCAAETVTKFGPRHDCCGLWSWGGAPLVDKKTHEARKAAHEAFDVLWKNGRMKRSDAYKALASRMNIRRADCHIKLMSADAAARVAEIAREIAASLKEEFSVSSGKATPLA